MANDFQDIEQRAKTLIDNIKAELLSLDQSVANVTGTMNTFFKSGNKSQDLAKNIKVVDTSLKEFDKTITKLPGKVKELNNAENELNNIYKSAIPNLKTLTSFEKQRKADIDGVNTSVKSAIPSLKQLASVKKADLDATKKQTQAALDNATATLRNKEALKQQKADYKKSLVAETFAIQDNKDALQKQKASFLELNRPYNQLIQKHKQAKKALQDATTAYGKHSGITKKAQREYDKLTKKVNQANTATQNFAKKGLKGAFVGFKNLLGAFGLIGGVQMIANFTKSLITTIKELDKLNFTLKSVSETEGDVARSKAFLTNLALKFGASLIDTTERYVKFSVAARNAGLSAKETEKIFGTVTKASAVLGLKTDELTGIYLALEQMLSKGKVTTEELRRQLGERLPGAFDLAAKAMGVTSAELDKMLKKGEVMAYDMLPKLTVEIEKAFGLEGLDSVETLQTATDKLYNSWILFVDALENSTSIGSGWQFILERMSIAMNGLGLAMKGVELVAQDNAFAEYFKELQDGAPKAVDEVKASINTLDALIKRKQGEYDDLFALGIPKPFTTDAEIKNAEDLLGTLKGRKKATESYLEVLKNQEKSEEEQRINLINTIELMKTDGKIREDRISLAELEAMSLEQLRDKYKELQIPQKGTIGYYQDLIKANENLRKQFKDTDKDLDKKVKKINEENEAYQKSIDLIRGKEKAEKKKKKEVELVKGTVGWLRQQISANNELIEQSKDKTEIAKLQTENKLTQEKIDLLLDLVDKTKLIKLNSADYFDDQIARLTAERDAVADNKKEYDLYTQLIDNIISAKKKLIGVTDDLTVSEDKSGKALKNFFSSFQDDFFSEAGFDGLNEMFVQTDDAGKTMFDNLMEAAETGGEQFAVVFDAMAEVAQETFNFINQNQEAQFEAQYARLEQAKEIELQFAGDSAYAREQIEERYEEKRKKIQEKQAKAQKKNAMFNIAIDTAQAIVATLGKTGFAGIPLSIIVGAIGAAQLALVASTPVPEFFRGTMNAPEGWASVDEKRPEIHTDRLGNIKSTGEGKANHRWLTAGDKIYSSHEEYFKKELGGVLEGNDILPYKEMLRTSSPVVNVNGGGIKKEDFVREIRAMKDGLMSKESSVVKIDKNGFYTGVRRKGAETERQNSILKLKGGIV